MKIPKEFKEELEKAKKQLVKLGEEAAVIAKKGEAELVKLSQKSKLHFDSTSITLQIERLYYLLGKEYVKSNAPAEPTAKIKKLLADIHSLEKQQKGIKKKLNSPESVPERRPAKKSAARI